MPILSIQSEVVYGHVGHQASRFILERMGHPVWAIPTVLFSNHLAHKTVTGRVLESAQVQELIDGVRKLGVLGQADAVLTGYLGAAQTAALVADVVSEVKKLNPQAIYILDPVIGDQGAMYVAPELAAALSDLLVPIADVLLPNVYELGHLTGAQVSSRAEAIEALHNLAKRSPARAIIGTGIPDPQHPEELAVISLARESAHDKGVISITVTKRLPLFASGTGDAFAALFTAGYLRGQNLTAAIEAAVLGMSHIVGKTALTHSDELKIIETQDQWSAALQP